MIKNKQHRINSREQSTNQKIKNLLRILLPLIFLFVLFKINIQELLPTTLLTTPTPLSIPPKQLIANSLPLRELWRWSGGVRYFEDPPKIVVQKDSIILASAERNIIVLNAQKGNILWKQPFWNLNSLAADDEHVYIGVIEKVLAYDLRTGEQQWVRELHKPRRGSLYVYPGNNQLEVYDYDNSFEPGDRYLHILNPQTGILEQTIEWPGIYFKQGDIYYVRIRDGLQTALVAQQQKPENTLWKQYFFPPRWPIFVDDLMIIKDGQIYALNVNTGEIVWQTPKLENRSGQSFGIDPNTIVSNIAIGGNTIYAITLSDTIVGYDADTGKEVGTVEMTKPDIVPAQLKTPSSIGNGYRFIAASDNYVAAYYGDSQELIVFERTDVAP